MRFVRFAAVAVLAVGAFVPTMAVRAHEGLPETPGPQPSIIARTTVYAFNGQSLDRRHWHTVEHRGAGQDTPYPEMQYYTPEAVIVDRGVLHLNALHYEILDPATGFDYPFEAGRVESNDTFLYGRINVRLKVPIGNGLWPSVWLRTPEGRPLGGQIDIYDGFGSQTQGFTASVANWVDGRVASSKCVIVENYAAFTNCTRIGNPQRKLINYAHEYHTFGIDWRPDHLTWYVDNKPYWTITSGIPTVPMVLVMNLAVGGVQDGEPPIPMHLKMPADFEIASVTISR